MNILFYAYDGFNPTHGGIERVSNNLTQGFLNAGYGVCFVSLKRGDYTPLAEQLLLPDEKNICVAENVEAFTAFALKHKVDVIICQHSYYLDFSSLPFLVKKNTGVKLLYAFHTTPLFKALYIAETSYPLLPSEKTFHKHYKRITRALLKRQKQNSRNRKMGEHIHALHEMGDGIVFLSERYIPVAQKISGITGKNNLFGIGNPNTYDSTEIKPVQKENTLLFVGRISPEKRPEKAMKIWQHIQHQFPDWNIKIVGGGAIEKDLEILKKKMKLERCSLEGYKDPAPFYEKAKILLVPSDFEGFGMSMIEGMQHGVVPFVFDTYEALPDIVENNVNGITVKPYDLNEFEEKLTALMRDEKKRAEMAEKGRKSVGKFELSHIIKQWQKVFQQIGLEV